MCVWGQASLQLLFNLFLRASFMHAKLDTTMPLPQDNTKTMGSSLTHAKSLTNAKSLGRSGSMLPTAKEDLSYTLGAARRSERRNLRKFVRMCEHMLLNCFREVSDGLP